MWLVCPNQRLYCENWLGPSCFQHVLKLDINSSHLSILEHCGLYFTPTTGQIFASPHCPAMSNVPKCTEVGPGCPSNGSSLGYAPNLTASIIFIIIFASSFFAHLGLGTKYKTWGFMTATLLGSSSEVIGYIGRVLMHNNPYKLSTSVHWPFSN
jgi:hypothetical protein